MRFSLAPLAAAVALAVAACTVNEPPASAPAQAAPELMKWPALLERPRPQPDETFRYGDAATQVVDLWLPSGRGPHPTVLMVHGGCWQTEIADRRIMNWIADDLRRRGIAVWNIDYRGVDREGGGYPGTFLDAAAAADALRDNAAKYRLDIAHLVAVGHSAGGHLALWLAAREAWAHSPLMVSFERRSRTAAQIESETGRLQAELRKLHGVDEITSKIDPRTGRSTTRVHFSSHTAFAEARPSVDGVIRASGIEGVMVTALPPESPLLSGDPIRIAKVVSLGGLPDLEEAARPPGSGCGTEVIAQISGGRFEETSVPRLAPLGVEQVLINGLQDRIIPPAYAEGYAGPVRAAGDRVKVRMIDRTGHVELIAPETAAWAAAVEEIKAGLKP